MRPQRTEPLCKYKVHPSHPGRGVAGKAGDLGTPKLHADTPPPHAKPTIPCRQPATPVSPGGQGSGPCFQGLGIFKQLLPALWEVASAAKAGARD